MQRLFLRKLNKRKIYSCTHAGVLKLTIGHRVSTAPLLAASIVSIRKAVNLLIAVGIEHKSDSYRYKTTLLQIQKQQLKDVFFKEIHAGLQLRLAILRSLEYVKHHFYFLPQINNSAKLVGNTKSSSCYKEIKESFVYYAT